MIRYPCYIFWRGGEILKERSDYDEARAKAYVEEMERVEAAEREAMDQISAEEAAARDEAAKAGMLFSRATLKNGRDYVHVDVEQIQFDAKTPSEQQRIAKRVILEKFKGKVIGEDGARAFVPKDAAGEYAYPAKRIKGYVHEAKMRTSPELDTLLSTAQFKGHNADDGRHPNAKGGWDHYDAIFEVGGKYFRGDIALLVDAKGRRRFHDVTQIKEETLSQLLKSTQGRSASSGYSARKVLQGRNPGEGSSATDIITNSSEGAQGGRKLLFSRAVKPSALGDGKQRYYEVPFDKAVDKIVKNKKPVSDEHVFVSETPKSLKDIGLPSLPVMMNQQHVVSCYFDKSDGVKAKDLHGLHGKLKSLPSALQNPLMIIASERNPSTSVVSIVRMIDKDGHSVIVPIEINGIGSAGGGFIDANIVKTVFGKQNAWSEKVAKAIRDEVDGKVSVFYIDKTQARQISNRLARDAFDFGKSEVQFLSLPRASNVIHSIADFGSPVKGVGAQKDLWCAGPYGLRCADT